MRRPLAGLALLLALAIAHPAFAQEEGGAEQPPPEEPVKREHRDLTFARSLGYGYGWYDLALEVLDDLERSRPPSDVLEQALLLRLDLKTNWATSMKDPEKRKEELKKVRADYEQVIKSKPNSEAGNYAKLRIGEMLLQEGDAAFLRMRVTDDPEARGQARKEAEAGYAQAEKYFEELKGEYEKARDEASTRGDQAKSDEAHYRLMHARFNRARSIYQQAQLFDRGSKDREDRLRKCIDLFSEINFEYGDQFMGYEAGIFLGLAAKDLGETKTAYAAFDSVLGIKDFYGKNDQGLYLFDEQGKDIVSRASYFKAQTLNEIKDYDGALNAVKELFLLIPDMARDRLGYATRVEEGTAWAGKGDLKRAQSILEKIIDEDKGGPWAAVAKERLALILGGPGVVVAPDRQIQAAESLIDRGRPAEGLNQLRFVIAALESATPEEQEKWLPAAWLKLGVAYNNLKRFDEAAACFDALVQRFKKCDQAPNALFQRAMVLSQLNGARPNEFDKQAYLETLKTLQRDYPDDPAAKASSFFLGMERFAARDYPTAAKEFEKTTPSAGKIYDAALYQAALSYFMEGRRLGDEKDKEKAATAKLVFAQAKVSLEKAIRWASTEAFEKKGVQAQGDRADVLRRIAFDARCRLAEIALHPLVKDPARALEAALAAEQGAGEGADPERIAQARLLMVRAHLAADSIAKAEEVVASMGTAAGQSPRTAQAERETAIAIDNQAQATRKAKAAPGAPVPPEAKALFAKAADHYTRWYEVAEKAGLEISGRDLVRAADKIYTLGLLVNGLDERSESFVEVDDLSKLEAPARFQTAAAVYEAALAAGAPDPWLLKIKLGECYGFAREFDQARVALADACRSQNLLKATTERDENGKPVEVILIDIAAAQARPILLFAYSDYARACFEGMGRDRKLLDECIAAYGRVLTATPVGQPIWWRAKYYLFAALYEKGDYDSALIGLTQLKRQNPGLDGGRFGLKDKFEALLTRLEQKKSTGK